ncbi:MAG: RNA polymerase sigma factor [Planctomycetes bacterium]|nr:RNA polymerase sigma factor [Planctomycetota bacterium]
MVTLSFLEPEDDRSEDEFKSLIRAAQLGDQAAWDTLYRKFHAYTWMIARYRLPEKLRSKLDSMDIVQTVWHDVFLSGLKNFKPKSKYAFMHWLSSRLIHKIQDKYKFWTPEKRDIDREAMLTGQEANKETPSQFAVANEQERKLFSALDDLPEDQRRVFIMHRLEGLDYQEIADKLGRSSEAVRKLWVRARDTVIKALI